VPLRSILIAVQRWSGCLLSPTGGSQTPFSASLHIYPASRGKVLRYIGKDIQGGAELLYEHAKSVLRVTVTSAKAATRPAPRKLNVRRRSSPLS
jgi:hypothetical protein